MEKIWRELIWREPIWREPDVAGSNEKALIRLALQVYVAQTKCPVVESYACRDHRSVQQTLYLHLGVPPAVKNRAELLVCT